MAYKITILNITFYINKYFYRRYVGLCGGIKIVALGIFLADWWLVRRRKHLETTPPLDPHKDIAGSIISLDKCEQKNNNLKACSFFFFSRMIIAYVYFFRISI